MTFTNWTLAMSTEDDRKYMRPLFEFLLLQFVEIFGETVLGAEQCIAYNDSTAPLPNAYYQSYSHSTPDMFKISPVLGTVYLPDISRTNTLCHSSV